MEIWSTIILAIIAASSPMFLMWLTSKTRSREKAEDYARQDLVAERVAEAARLVMKNNELVAKSTLLTNEKLDTIHGLVNSKMTAALQADHDQTVTSLALMYELVAINRSSGKEPNADTLEAIEATKLKISRLKAILADRNRKDDFYAGVAQG